MRPTSNAKRATTLLAALALVLASGGCGSIPGGNYVSNLAAKTFQPGRISREELREALVQFASRFEATVVATADTITVGTQDPVIQRRALRWKIGMSPAINQAAFQPDALAAYVAMLTLATSLDEYLTTGGGKAAFGDQQSLAVEASGEIAAAARDLGHRFLDEKDLQRVTRQVEMLVAEQPIRGEFVAETVQKLVTTSASNPAFDWVTAIPMSPFRALQGVDEEPRRSASSTRRPCRWRAPLPTCRG